MAATGRVICRWGPGRRRWQPSRRPSVRRPWTRANSCWAARRGVSTGLGTAREDFRKTADRGVRGGAARAQRLYHAAPVPHGLHAADGVDRGGVHRPGALYRQTLWGAILVPALVRRHSVRRYVSAAAAHGVRPVGGGGGGVSPASAPLRERGRLRGGAGDTLLAGGEAGAA